jgi:hypothetical protein
LAQTLSTLRPDLPWEVAQGSLELYNLENLPFKVKYSLLPETTHPDFHQLTLKKKSGLNYSHALSLGNPFEYTLLIEDDVSPSNDFLMNLTTVMHKLKPEHDIVALYSCYDWGEKQDIVPYPINDFYGTQAMLFSPKIRPKLAKFIHENAGTEPYDFLIKKFNHPIYAAARSLFQHTGEISTGLGYHHRTFNFIDDAFTNNPIRPETI